MSSLVIWRCPTTDFVVEWEKPDERGVTLYASRQDREGSDVQVRKFREKRIAYCDALKRSRKWTKDQEKRLKDAAQSARDERNVVALVTKRPRLYLVK